MKTIICFLIILTVCMVTVCTLNGHEYYVPLSGGFRPTDHNGQSNGSYATLGQLYKASYRPWGSHPDHTRVTHVNNSTKCACNDNAVNSDHKYKDEGNQYTHRRRYSFLAQRNARRRE